MELGAMGCFRSGIVVHKLMVFSSGDRWHLTIPGFSRSFTKHNVWKETRKYLRVPTYIIVISIYLSICPKRLEERFTYPVASTKVHVSVVNNTTSGLHHHCLRDLVVSITTGVDERKSHFVCYSPVGYDITGRNTLSLTLALSDKTAIVNLI